VPRRLQALSDLYFRAKTQALEYPEPELRVRVEDTDLRSWHAQLLAALGYASEPLLFKQEDRPRWVLLLAGSRVYLLDAHTYAQGRCLYVNLDDAFARKQAKTFASIAALLSRDTLAPGAESDEILHGKLRAGSLRSTHGVSEKLQGAVREAITEIANGWVEARREQKLGFRVLGEREDPLPDGSREVTAEQLRHEALDYVYRILFCLYAEARGRELGILPISDDVYRLGYSLEALRDLADRGEPGTTTENGTYYAQHLDRLFRLIHEGFHPEARPGGEQTPADRVEDVVAPWRIGIPQQTDLFGGEGPRQLSLGETGRKALEHGYAKAFVVEPLTATRFDPEATPLLERVQLANRVLHKVIRCLSLGTGQSGRQVGRINYAELGIVQLGSVYEGLLSYRGFFAGEELIQVLQAPQPQRGEQPVVHDDEIDPKTPTWFVPKTRLEEFKRGEVVIERRTRQPRIYRTGEFILHLNGVDRVNSASYCTPAVLTETLVRETLEERLKQIGPEQADEILTLTICEPAMGSAAFLVEALGQLADRYLVLKQAQLGRTIDPGDYDDQRRRVMHHIAVHNIYGVDLNSTAVELGALSLWLVSIHRLRLKKGENGEPDLYRTCATPWFGLRLRPGNSLIGARRAVWSEEQLTKGRFYGKHAEAPRQLAPGEARKPGEIYHFLVWDEDMAPAARNRLMRGFCPDECKAAGDWHRHQVKKKWTPEQLAAARRICEGIDGLWQDYATERLAGLARTRCASSVWPEPTPADVGWTKRSGSTRDAPAPAEHPDTGHAGFRSSTQPMPGEQPGADPAADPGSSLARQEAVKARLESDSGAFQRLRLLMDAWCGLYFWPLDATDALPSREAWLAAAEVLLGVGIEYDATRRLLDLRLGDQIDLETLCAAVQGRLPDAAARRQVRHVQPGAPGAAGRPAPALRLPRGLRAGGGCRRLPQRPHRLPQPGRGPDQPLQEFHRAQPGPAGRAGGRRAAASGGGVRRPQGLGVSGGVLLTSNGSLPASQRADESSFLRCRCEGKVQHQCVRRHWNPVKHGWVSRVVDWPYSSFHRYVRRGILPPDWAWTEENMETGE
jgi:hypothetical protein